MIQGTPGDKPVLPVTTWKYYSTILPKPIMMKKFILFITGIVCAITGLRAQEKPGPLQTVFAHSPVIWQYDAKKVSGNTYELYITAFIKPGWHLYSQHQPEDAIALPTAIKFYADSSVTLEGHTKEEGHLEKDTIASLGISAYQYTGKVAFLQRVKVKEPVPVSIIGSITYQVCRNNECLQPETRQFGIRLKSSYSPKKTN
ncbi:MAG: protein-disulfide reductase DsbD domain-containing protein [Chitinophagaceae bacterium]